MSKKIEVPLNEDGIIELADKIYGQDTEDFHVFRKAAETRKIRRQIVEAYTEIKYKGTPDDEAFYIISREFTCSVSSVKSIISKREIYGQASSS